MLIQTLILIIAFIANIWLWGHWSFDKPLGLSLFLVVTSLMMLGVCWLSLTTFIKKRSLKELNTKKLWKIFLIVSPGLDDWTKTFRQEPKVSTIAS